MPTYEYIALDATGKKSRGSVAAESAVAARKLLRNRRLHATKLTAVSETTRQGGSLTDFFAGSRRRVLVLNFTRQITTMIQAEVKLTEALEVLIKQSENRKFTQIMQNLRDQLLSGENLADGLKEYPLWFDQIYVSMVRVGEATGNLGKSLSLLTDYIARKHRLETKIKSAMVYPIILMTVCVGATLFLMTYLIPKLAKIIAAAGRDLPTITKIVLGISHFLLNYWWALIIGIFAVSGLFHWLINTKRGRHVYDRTMLNLPVLGGLLRQSIVARFATTLAALIRSGMPIAEGLRVVEGITGNSILAGAINASRDRIMSGSDIATPLLESKVVDNTIAHMISVGERSGELEAMLLTIADNLEESSDIVAERMASVMEPLIIVIMAAIVGTILYAVIMPILQVSNIAT